MKSNKRTVFIPSALPHNRKEQFRDIINHRFMLLVLNCIFILLGFTPLLFVYFFTSYISDSNIFLGIIQNYGFSEEMQGFAYFWTMNISYLAMIPLFLIGFLFLGGGLRIYRLLSWDQGVFFFHDFFVGVKRNAKYSLLIGLFLGFYVFVSKFIGSSFSYYVDGSLGIGVELFLKAVLQVFFLPICLIVMLISTYFDDKFINIIKNAFYIYSSKVIFFILLSIVLLLVTFLPYMGNVYLLIIATTILGMFGMPFYILVWNQLFLSRIDFFVDDSKIKLKGLYDPSKFNKEK